MLFCLCLDAGNLTQNLTMSRPFIYSMSMVPTCEMKQPQTVRPSALGGAIAAFPGVSIFSNVAPLQKCCALILREISSCRFTVTDRYDWYGFF